MIKLVFLSILTAIVLSSIAQDRKATKTNVIFSYPTNKISAFSKLTDPLRSRAICVPDTISNTTPTDTPTVYDLATTACMGAGWGYISGTNCYLDIAEADGLNSGAGDSLKGGIFWFGVATDGGNNTMVNFTVWDATGAGISPGNALGTEGVLISNIAQDVDSNRVTYVEFDPPISIGQNTDFFLGVEVSNTPGDTIALMTNSDPQSSPSTAWDQWSDNVWHVYDATDNWGLQISHYIWAILTLQSPVADFIYLDGGLQVNFINQSNNATSYLWNFGDGVTDTSENPGHTYSSANTYTVTLISSNSCGSDTITQNIVISGINELGGLASNLSVYPNPNNGIFNIAIQVPISGEMTIHLFNMTGKEVYREHIKDPSIALNKQINIPALTKGIYHLQLSMKEGILHRKVIIQ